MSTPLAPSRSTSGDRGGPDDALIDFHLLPGSLALSSAQAAALLTRLRTVEPALTGLSATWFYLVRASRPLDRDTVARLQALLDDNAVDWPTSGRQIHVTAREGTISPWSSKAQDIAHHCGLAEVDRIERGVSYRLEAAGDGHSSLTDRLLRSVGLARHGPIATEARTRLAGGNTGAGADGTDRGEGDADGNAGLDLARLADLLHDRMIESWYASRPEPARFFRPVEPAPLAAITLDPDPRAALAAANTALGLALSPDEIDYLVARLRRPGARPDRCRTDDVRAGQFRALPAQDFQCPLRPRRRAASRIRCSIMIKATHHAHPAGHEVAYADNAAILTGPRITSLRRHARPRPTGDMLARGARPSAR